MATLVPDYRIDLDGRPAPHPLCASIEAIDVEAGLAGVDALELRLLDTGLRWLDHPALVDERSVALQLGYVGSLTQVFVGEIVGRQASFPADGPPHLTITAHDRRHRMQGQQRTRWFGVPTRTSNLPIPDLALTTTLALEHGLIPLTDPVSAVLSAVLGYAEAAASVVQTGGAQRLIRKQSTTDYAFLVEIAKENGWDLRMEHQGPLGGRLLRFHSPMDHLEPDRTLQYGRSLIEFNARISTVGQVASVAAHVWESTTRQRFTVSVGWDWERSALDVGVTPQFVPLEAEGQHVVSFEPLSVLSAPRKLLTELMARLNQRLTGSGSCIGDPGIRPGAVLRLEGLGVEFGGLYRVTSATHSLSASGYITRFEVRKEVWFDSVAPYEQRAIPVETPLATRLREVM